MPRRPTYLIGFLLGGAPRFVVLALGAPIWLIVAVYVVSGFSMGFINPIIGAIQFERAPREMYGRVRTLVVAVAWSGIPFGGLVGGGLVALLGLSPAPAGRRRRLPDHDDAAGVPEGMGRDGPTAPPRGGAA